MIGVWHLEWLRLWRTRRLFALVAVFLLLGLSSPVLIYYLPELLEHSTGNGIQIILPQQTAADGIASFASNIAQVGSLVVVVVAAATFAFDARPGLAAFYRMRVRRRSLLILPRVVAIIVATTLALGLGTFGAWYETTLLLGRVPLESLLQGFLLTALWFCFVTSLVAFLSGLIRSLISVIGASLGLLLVLALLGSFSFTATWNPTSLSGSMADFMHESPAHHGPAVTVALISSLVLLGASTLLIARREPLGGSGGRP